MSDESDLDTTRQEKIDAIRQVINYDPRLVASLIVIGLVAALLEGVGLTFLLPIIEIIQGDSSPAQADGLIGVFVSAYQFVGIPFTLEYVIGGVAAVMTLRFTMRFLIRWFSAYLQLNYRRYLQKELFDSALKARISYYDKKGSDEILNTILTETYYSARTIKRFQPLTQAFFLIIAYLSIAFIVAPGLTLVSVAVLGVITVLFRFILEPGFSIGERVAAANERRQEVVQAGTMGIRDVRIFSNAEEIYEDFLETVEVSTTAEVKVSRNEAVINSYYRLSIVLFVFGLIYAALRFANLSFGELGLFLFAMFQVGPRVSGFSQKFYRFQNDLPHLIRTQQFVQELRDEREPTGGSRQAPQEVETLEFDDVSFSYNDDEVVFRDLDFTVSKGEFIGFVGQSGVGKSTIVSLIARFYGADSGNIRANDVPIDQMDLEAWRDRLAIVRQDPFIFNDTLRYNLTIGNRDASQTEIERASEIAKIDEFLDDLPNGYDSELGDDGVRLSGGQQQRVALARALLTDADVLILDEATSDLDSNLEREVQRAIEGLDREYMIIAIAHRLSTVENADQIFTMEEQGITERGKHSELVENGGKYAELYAIQAQG